MRRETPSENTVRTLSLWEQTAEKCPESKRGRLKQSLLFIIWFGAFRASPTRTQIHFLEINSHYYWDDPNLKKRVFKHFPFVPVRKTCLSNVVTYTHLGPHNASKTWLHMHTQFELLTLATHTHTRSLFGPSGSISPLDQSQEVLSSLAPSVMWYDMETN